MDAARLVVGDDSDLTILGVRAVIEGDYRFQVVGLARDTAMLFDVAGLLQPEIVLWNEACHTLDALTVLGRLREIVPDAKLLMIGGLTDGLLIRDLTAAGLNGYLHRSDDLTLCLLDALTAMMRGKPYFSPTPRAAYHAALLRDRRKKPSALDDELRSVLQLLAEGATVSEIAATLHLSEKRVYRLRTRLKRRFNANTNEHLIQRAAAEGFVTLVSP